MPREVNYLRQMFHDILHEKREQLALEKNQQEHVEGDILGTMMRGGEFSDSELVDQMLTFLAAGVCLHLSLSSSLWQQLEPNGKYSMKPQPVLSPGAATISAKNHTSKTNSARKSTTQFPPPKPPSPGKT